MPSNYIKLRDEAAEQEVQDAVNVHNESPEQAERSFKHGADWSRKQTLEDVKPLVEALDKIGKAHPDGNPAFLIEKAQRALAHFNTMKGGEGER